MSKRILRVFMMSVMAVGITRGEEPASVTPMSSQPGAAQVFASSDPKMRECRRLIEAGELAKAERLLEGLAGDEGLARDAQDGREIIRRLRREYDLSLADLVQRLRASIPDVKAEDVERWREAGQVQHRILDGKVCYFRREPSNIFRFCDEAKRRRDENRARRGTRPAGPDEEAVLVEHLQKVLSAAQREGRELVVPIQHRITYALTVRPDHPAVKPGATVRCWLPFPQECPRQTGVKLLSTDPAEHVLAPNAGTADAKSGAAQRTVYLERKVARAGEPVTFREEFEYVCSAYVPRLRDADARPLPAGAAAEFLAERPPHIVFTPELKAAVAKAVGDETNPLARARRVFLWICKNVKYCSEQEYCVIPNISGKVLTSRKGDCGAQSLLLITMCRAAGIPARWQSGWETRPVGWDMHDWAEVYVEPWGWIPVDASYGLKKSDDPAVREFYFGHIDSYRMIVNVDYGAALTPPKAALRSEPLDFQRGEVEIDGKNLYYEDWDYRIDFDWKELSAG